MFYQMYEFNHAVMAPWRAAADAMRVAYRNPFNPLSHTAYGRAMAAGFEVFERATRRYGKPEFGLPLTVINGEEVSVHEKIVWSKPFCNLLHFERVLPPGAERGPKLLMVAPMSGHYATLLRGTVETMLPHADVYITDWVDARMVPLQDGTFDLDDYIDYVIEMIRHLGPDTHLMAVCQPSVPVLAAAAVMAMDEDPNMPASMTLMGGPIDTRSNPTAVNRLAEKKPIEWFADNVIMQVPWPQPGAMRLVYPGFLQLSGFMSMNLDRHVNAQKDFFFHLVKNDGEPAEKHREFYDEYLAVMDLTAEFYLQTVDTVFIRHALPKGEMTHRGRLIDLKAITKTALMTVEGENDDISGVGQTAAAQTLCSSIPDNMRMHYMQPDVGHYGVFNGSRFRREIAPRILTFMKDNAVENRGQTVEEPRVVKGRFARKSAT
ncbi:polyhydroxyalkanoate depolymerase [Rhizobium sp. C4]|uniref:polyhydroxyalkanoate depolymerase n=1 Tax=Rhizobium sp. C4 TaxID=1349800 RepID=UPI001E62FEB6|nr:polyhydroxyalkanoate depolymerase [Rhizobium sp. C4]MCD2174682.1 polyhydroxyalkanoate depolymerase [Rhizobium sp. C4]